MHHYFVCGLAIASIKRDGMIQTGTVPSYRSTVSVPNLLTCIVVKDPIINETDGRPDGYFTCCDRYMMYGTVYHGSSLSIDAQKIPTSRLSTLNATSLPTGRPGSSAQLETFPLKATKNTQHQIENIHLGRLELTRVNIIILRNLIKY